MGGAEGAVDPLRAAIAIATNHRPTLKPEAILKQLDMYAHQAQPMLAHKNNALVGVVNHVLFDRQGFTGNREQYSDPLNSYMDEVLKRRRGLPILLALVFVETANRAAMLAGRADVAHGIGLPGHFVAAVDVAGDEDQRVYVDAFGAGEILSADDCRELVVSHGAGWRDAYLEPVTGEAWALRMLTNLKNVYLEMHDVANAAATLEQMLVIEPSRPRHNELVQLYQVIDKHIARNN